MPSCDLRACGRELTIKFTCGWCGNIEYVPYDEVMDNEDCYLHQSKLPSGWGEVYYGRILCKDCADKFKKFMEG